MNTSLLIVINAIIFMISATITGAAVQKYGTKDLKIVFFNCSVTIVLLVTLIINLAK